MTDDGGDKLDATRLEESERRFRALAEHGSDCMILIDANGVLTYASPSTARALGRTLDEIVGTPALHFVHPDDQAAVYAAGRGSQPGTTTELTLRLLHADGTYRVHEGTCTNLLHDPAVRALVNNHRDVTARKKLEAQLRQSQKMEAIGLLAGGVAHDFNNLLAIITGFTELAARRLGPGHPVLPQLAEVEGAARRGGDLTKKLLAFSRKQIIQVRALDVRDAVHGFIGLLQRIVGEDVELRAPRADEALVVKADPAQLEQVLLNLCTNARQAMPDGGTLSIVARSASFDEAAITEKPWARPGEFVEIAVTDTGVGMDEATRARVFEPFFTTKREGTGLGLASVYGIVEQHGGFVHIESAPGQGATFRVHLPRTRDVPRPAELDGTPAAASVRGTEMLLVAEDEPSLRAVLTTTLSELGYRVIAARDGAEAVDEYARHTEDVALVVLDVVMPRLDAREAYDRILALRPDAKVLFVTGYAPASTRLAEVLSRGDVPVLEKPFTPAALAAAVRAALDA